MWSLFHAGQRPRGPDRSPAGGPQQDTPEQFTEAFPGVGGVIHPAVSAQQRCTFYLLFLEIKFCQQNKKQEVMSFSG